jgi:aminoglycoside phosphotransferase family enzyme/predicted kinase
METEDQREVIDFLAAPATHGGAPVECVETHASVVFLAGGRALKLKRAVQYDYLDFSTAARRRTMCEAELRLNQRTAPALYRGVVAVTRERGGSLALGGTGVPVDWVIDMRRFDQDGLFDRLAARGALDPGLMRPLAAAIAELHRASEPCPDQGGRHGMAWVVDGNAAGFAEEGAGVLDTGTASRVTGESRALIARHGTQLDARRDTGFVRRCHGDLHLRNIVLIDGRPTLFDAIEFNDAIACIDVLYDLAFLIMDVWRRRLPRHANIILNEYLGETLDFEGISLLPLFLSCRAAVRAKTSVTAATLHSDPSRRRELADTSRAYLSMADELLRPPGPCLVAIGGYSGSGKSTLARGLAPAMGAVPGALIVRTDEVRKRLLGVPPLSPLGTEGYTPDVTRQAYAAVAARAGSILAAGHSVVVDAVFARAADREAVESVARAAAVPFAGVWLEAPESTLAERTTLRRGDASDADPATVRAQVAAGAGTVGWDRVAASSGPEHVLRHAATLVARRVGHGSVAWADVP